MFLFVCDPTLQVPPGAARASATARVMPTLVSGESLPKELVPLPVEEQEMHGSRAPRWSAELVVNAACHAVHMAAGATTPSKQGPGGLLQPLFLPCSARMFLWTSASRSPGLPLSHIISHAGYRSLTPGSLLSRKGHEYLSQMSPGQEDGHSFPPPLLTPASYKALAAPAPSVLGAAIPGASGIGNTSAGATGTTAAGGAAEDDPYTVRAAALLALTPTGEHRYVWQSGRRT
jgi:hypothetical protein